MGIVLPRTVKLLIGLLLIFCAKSAFAETQLSPADLKLIRLACRHSIVFFGENAHGDGATIALKARLVPELARRCGFSAMAFESSFYDFAELVLETSVDEPYDRKKLLSAIGLIWSAHAEISSLADWLALQTPKKFKLAGIDDQFGSRGAFYSISIMPAQMSALVPKQDQALCLSLLKLEGWLGLEGNAQRLRIDQCLIAVLDALKDRNDSQALHLRAMAEAYRRANSRNSLQEEESSAARDSAMADNLASFRKSLPRGTKILVWTANAHAAYGGYAVGQPLAQITRARFGKDVFSVGFSSAGGHYR